MKKSIYAVMCKTRKRESKEPLSEPYLVYCTETKQEAEEDCKKFNEKDDFRRNFIQEEYYVEEVTLYTKN